MSIFRQTWSRLLLLAVVLAGMQAVVPGQQAPAQPSSSSMVSPTFDVASIRQNKEGEGHSDIWSNPANGNFRTNNVSLRALLQVAYSLPQSRIVNIPSAMDKLRFNIEAKSDPSINDRLSKLPADQGVAEKRQMLQALLSDRFQLKTHRETRELPVYVLVVAKSGAKLQAWKSNGTTVNAGTSYIHIQGGANSIDVLAGTLATQLGRPVLNKTGIKGTYKITLTWTPDDQIANSSAASGPSLFTAIQEQLGLKLEAAKAPVEVLVVDHVEPPSPN